MGRDRWGGIGSVGREREKVRCSGSGTGVVVGGGGRGGDKGGVDYFRPASASTCRRFIKGSCTEGGVVRLCCGVCM